MDTVSGVFSSWLLSERWLVDVLSEDSPLSVDCLFLSSTEDSTNSSLRSLLADWIDNTLSKGSVATERFQPNALYRNSLLQIVAEVCYSLWSSEQCGLRYPGFQATRHNMLGIK
jgi:hypothetical protein